MSGNVTSKPVKLTIGSLEGQFGLETDTTFAIYFVNYFVNVTVPAGSTSSDVAFAIYSHLLTDGYNATQESADSVSILRYPYDDYIDDVFVGWGSQEPLTKPSNVFITVEWPVIY